MQLKIRAELWISIKVANVSILKNLFSFLPALDNSSWLYTILGTTTGGGGAKLNIKNTLSNLLWLVVILLL